MEDFPRDLPEFEARFSMEAACREYLFRLRWPDGFCCPRCGGRKTLASIRRSAAMFGLQLPKFGDCRDDFSGHSYSPDGLVSGDVVGHQPEEWRQRLGAATSAGPEEL